MFTHDVYRYGGQVIISYEFDNGTRLYVEGTMGLSGSRLFLIDKSGVSFKSKTLSGSETTAFIGVNFR